MYGNTVPSGSYTVFGKVSAAGMKVVDAIAAKGVEKNAQSGKPVSEAKISTITVPGSAVEPPVTGRPAAPRPATRCQRTSPG